MTETVAFEADVVTRDAAGAQVFATSAGQTLRAEFIYARGGEGVASGGLRATATFKVRLMSCAATRSLTADHRMRDLRRGGVYNIRELDVVTDPLHVWLVAEAGVAA